MVAVPTSGAANLVFIYNNGTGEQIDSAVITYSSVIYLPGHKNKC